MMLLGGVIMKDANCPKCGSGEVYSGAELIVKDGPIANLLKGGPLPAIQSHKPFKHGVHRQLCLCQLRLC